jgi:hypothetical protein
MNRVRLICKEGERHSLLIKSNLDATYRMESKTDEDIYFMDESVVVIQNKREEPCAISIEALRLPDGRRAVLRPSRQAHRWIVDPEVSQVHNRIDLVLGGTESCVLTSSEFKGRTGGGAVFPV